ncbi:hypothetical protein [Sinomonas sp. B1-1]|uniref:hypothetical protein n=1 Tax=Sinomonas sp. B1-1 TaxID=3141454 RepID=UPI003D2E8AF9
MDASQEAQAAKLGRAQIDLDELAAIAARAAGTHDGARQIERLTVEPVPGEVYNMTTECLNRVSGTVDGLPFSLIVKVCRSPLYWSGIAQVPEALRAYLAKVINWRTELDAYNGQLAATLPEGMAMPVIYLVRELPGEYAAIWMQDVLDGPEPWEEARFARAAYLLGRFAGSPDVQRPPERPLRFFYEGAARHVFIPRLLSREPEDNPVIAQAADPALLADLRAFALRAEDYLAELEALPRLRAHGDASPQNLFASDGSMTAIDWGSYSLQPVGFDLGQLLAGRINSGELGPDALPALAPLVQDEYARGLEDAGARIPRAVVRRGHVLSMAIFNCLSALSPRELADGDSPALRERLRTRAGMARFLLDAVRETA